MDRSGCRSFALDNSWSHVVDVLQSNLIHVNRMKSLKFSTSLNADNSLLKSFRKLLIKESLFSADNTSAFAYLLADSLIFDEFLVKRNPI